MRQDQPLVTVDMKETRPFAANGRDMRRWMKEGLTKALAFWHKTFLPLHFTVWAYTRYPTVYRRRKGTKRRRYRSAGSGEWRSTSDPRPLYETGYARMLALSGYRITGASVGGKTALGRALLSVGAATRNQVGVRIAFTVPNYLVYLRGKGFDPDAELTAMNRQEVRELGKLAVEHVKSQHLGAANAAAIGADELEEALGISMGAWAPRFGAA